MAYHVVGESFKTKSQRPEPEFPNTILIDTSHEDEDNDTKNKQFLEKEIEV